MNNNKSKKYLIGLAVAILLPLSFYLYTDVASSNKVHVPLYYVLDRVDSSVKDGKTIYDSVFHKTADIRLTNQLGKQVSINEDLKGSILVVDFFFTSCPSTCPMITRHMAMLQKAFKKNDTAVHFVSISVDPARDSFPVLRKWADSYKANHDYWWFLTGDRKEIYNYARNELHVNVQPGDGGAEDFIHTDKFVLLDKDRYIRGYYNGLDSADMKRCSDDIVLLIFENKRRH